MFKSDLVKIISEKANISVVEARKIVNLMFDSMTKELSNGGRVELRKFGTFYLSHTNSYQGFNPKTGKPIAVEAKYRPIWRSSSDVVERINLNEKPEQETEIDDEIFSPPDDTGGVIFLDGNIQGSNNYGYDDNTVDDDNNTSEISFHDNENPIAVEDYFGKNADTDLLNQDFDDQNANFDAEPEQSVFNEMSNEETNHTPKIDITIKETVDEENYNKYNYLDDEPFRLSRIERDESNDPNNVIDPNHENYQPFLIGSDQQPSEEDETIISAPEEHQPQIDYSVNERIHEEDYQKENDVDDEPFRLSRIERDESNDPNNVIDPSHENYQPFLNGSEPTSPENDPVEQMSTSASPPDSDNNDQVSVKKESHKRVKHNKNRPNKNKKPYRTNRSGQKIN